MLDVAILADDLTGAADCGIAFASAGLPTFVAFADAPAPAAAQVLAIDTDSRRMAEREAVERARSAALRAHRDGARAVYKKIDSTLRGHVGAEIAATLRAESEVGRGRTIVLLSPAFPGAGRTMRGVTMMTRSVSFFW